MPLDTALILTPLAKGYLMSEKKFEPVALTPTNKKYNDAIKRFDTFLSGEQPLYKRDNDIRDEFERDYTRILHSTAFRRLKHKTQVFYAPHNDHVCTRMEHALHVSSVAKTIAKELGLNTALTSAISLGHDIGHAPFGHYGEECLNEIIAQKENGVAAKENKGSFPSLFWHERNSLFFADFIEMLPSPEGSDRHLDLTYAVRDGFICHCGEKDSEDGLHPRDNVIDLYSIKTAGAAMPFTWEGCVVRAADSIAYLGRDIEDAKQYKIISDKLLGEFGIPNKTELVNDLIVNICKNSSIEKGIRYSKGMFEKLCSIKKFSIKYIYNNYRMLEFKKYAHCVIDTLYNALINYYRSGRIAYAHELCEDFKSWCEKYNKSRAKFDTKDITSEQSYQKCVIEYISGMSDSFAMRMHSQIISF